MSEAHGGHGGHGDGASDLEHQPLLPASPNIGVGGFMIVILAILTSIMQGSFVVGSSHDMHVWPAANSAAVDLPPFTP